MDNNYFRVSKLVKRSTAPVYKNEFVLTTDVNKLARVDDFKKCMALAAESSPDAWYLHFHTKAREPRDTIRVIPSILNAFNSSRVLRRSRVSGLRMCNLYQSQTGTYFYVSDMVVSCAFDAVALASSLADFCKLGNRVYVSFEYPKKSQLSPKRSDYRDYAEQLIKEFWSRSMLARHAVFVTPQPHDVLSFFVTLVFEPKSIELWPLLEYIFRSLGDKLAHISINNNETLIISRKPQIEDDLYFAYKPTDVFAGVRYRNFSAFGTFYNNPNYLF